MESVEASGLIKLHDAAVSKVNHSPGFTNWRRFLKYTIHFAVALSQGILENTLESHLNTGQEFHGFRSILLHKSK